MICIIYGHLKLCLSWICWAAAAQRLRTLNLAENQITRLEHLSQLPHLEVLDVSSNRIERIPKLQRVHRSLGTLKLAHNRLASLAGIDNLRSFKNLGVLALEGNCLGAHARPYAIFSLPTLDIVDSVTISTQVCWGRCARLALAARETEGGRVSEREKQRE